MTIGTMTSKGQVTIPKPVRDRLHLRTGDRMEFSVSEEGTIIIRPRTSRIEDVMGMLSRYAKGRNVSVEDMDRGIAEGFRRGKL